MQCKQTDGQALTTVESTYVMAEYFLFLVFISELHISFL